MYTFVEGADSTLVLQCTSVISTAIFKHSPGQLQSHGQGIVDSMDSSMKMSLSRMFNHGKIHQQQSYYHFGQRNLEQCRWQRCMCVRSAAASADHDVQLCTTTSVELMDKSKASFHAILGSLFCVTGKKWGDYRVMRSEPCFRKWNIPKGLTSQQSPNLSSNWREKRATSIPIPPCVTSQAMQK